MGGCVSDTQCDQIWRNSTTLANIEKSLAIYLRSFGFGQSFQLTLAQFVCFWANFIAVNGQILKIQSDHLVTLMTLLFWLTVR